MIFFTSDEHYGHNNIIRFCNRPFADTSQMTEKLIRRHNEKVGKGDLVYHLGDMFWRTFGMSAAMDVMDRLHGQHYYIRGNHDEMIDKNPMLRSRFIWIKDLAKVHLLGTPSIILCHYAMRTWPGDTRGSWHLYGHSHGCLPENGTLSMDVGVDAVGYAPISLDEVAARMTGDKVIHVPRIPGTVTTPVGPMVTGVVGTQSRECR